MSEKEDDHGSLPGAVGAIAKIADSKPFGALLTPAFAELGNYWGELAKDATDKWRQKREKNVRAHTAKVLLIEGPLKESPSEKQAALSIEWAAEAQSIDPDSEPDLASLWQAILGQISSNNIDAEAMLRALRTLNNRQARLLLNLPDSQWFYLSTIETSDIQMLIESGLAVRFGFNEALLQYRLGLFSCVVTAAFIVVSLPILKRFPINTLFLIDPELVVGLLQMLAVLPIVLLATLLLRRVGQLHLTDLGEALRLSGRRYR